MNKIALRGVLALFTSISQTGWSATKTVEDLWLEKPVGSAHELVMAEGTTLKGSTAFGLVQVTAESGTTRTYTWDDGQCVRSAKLWLRDVRWYGSYGLYFPGVGHHWADCQGITRGVLEEGQLHFATQEAAQLWLDQEKAACLSGAEQVCDVVHSADGLVLRFGKTLPRGQLDVAVFQLYVSGVKPQDLAGASKTLGFGPAH